MKWFAVSMMFFLVVLIGLVLIRNQSPLQKVTNYKIYYGDMTSDILEDMKKYDMVIVEAMHFDESMVETLKDAGVKVIGYISVSEVGWWDTEIIQEMDRNQYITSGHKPLMNGKNMLGDLATTHFRNVLLRMIEERIMQKGMDGIFFDTLDTVDIIKDESERFNQAMGYTKLIMDIRLKWNNIILIQNRGFHYTNYLERGMIDGLLWENFSAELMNEPRYKQRAMVLNRLRWFANVRTLALAYKDEEASRAVARRNHWIYSYLDGQEGLMTWDDTLNLPNYD